MRKVSASAAACAGKRGRGGSKPKYQPDYCRQAVLLCEFGARDCDLAKFFKVSRETIHQWRKRYAAFDLAMKVSKDAFDDRVEHALYERATGYSCPDTYCAVSDGSIVTKQIVKHYPPDPASMIFWLKNRQPDRWKERVEHTGTDGAPLVDPRLIAAAQAIAAKL